MCRGQRFLAVILLFYLPSLVIILVRVMHAGSRYMPGSDMVSLNSLFQAMEFNTVLFHIAQVAAPLTILLFTSGMIRDEQEDQTLTYLLLCPIPRWALFLTKFAAAFLLVWLLTALGIAINLSLIWVSSELPGRLDVFARFFVMLPCFGLLILAHGAIFASIALVFQKSLILSVLYMALVEGFLANLPFALRKITAIHYFQNMICHFLGVSDKKDWYVSREPLLDIPQCLFALMLIAVAGTSLGILLFTHREFRVKTPEGN